jgi:N-acetylglutamate synthase-like GNAT family acetyltransferase
VGLVGLIVEGDEAEVESLIVSNRYRGKGVGKKLVETVIFESRNLGIKFLSAKPVARNIQAIQFFYKRDFKNLGHINLILDLVNYPWKPGPRLFRCEFKY